MNNSKLAIDPNDFCSCTLLSELSRGMMAKLETLQPFIIWLARWAGNMNRISCCDWLPERARWSYLARSWYGHCPARKIIMFWCFIPYNKSFIDQACSVKMAGYWPNSIFACLWLWTSTSSRSINTQKKNLANIQPSWPHARSITQIYWTSAIMKQYHNKMK